MNQFSFLSAIELPRVEALKLPSPFDLMVDGLREQKMASGDIIDHLRSVTCQHGKGPSFR